MRAGELREVTKTARLVCLFSYATISPCRSCEAFARGFLLIEPQHHAICLTDTLPCPTWWSMHIRNGTGILEYCHWLPQYLAAIEDLNLVLPQKRRISHLSPAHHFSEVKRVYRRAFCFHSSFISLSVHSHLLR